MKDKLVEFVNALDQNPQLQQEYSQDPRYTLDNFGVALKDIELLLSGDISAIKSRLNMTGITALVIVRALK